MGGIWLVQSDLLPIGRKGVRRRAGFVEGRELESVWEEALLWHRRLWRLWRLGGSIELGVRPEFASRSNGELARKSLNINSAIAEQQNTSLVPPARTK